MKAKILPILSDYKPEQPNWRPQGQREAVEFYEDNCRKVLAQEHSSEREIS
jgi:hypothetical protein